MTGGLAYFLDEDGSFSEKVNPEIVKLQRVCTPVGESQLKGLIQAHFQQTGSQKAKLVLDSWQSYLGKFWQVVPPSEADSLEANPDAVVVEEEKALSSVK
jgi:glutamate synthase (ferredoxin)